MMKQKVLFVQKLKENEFETEGLWCTQDGDNYIVDNIPFIAKRIALGDVIKTEYDEGEDAYYFDDFVTVSGNSTVRMYFDDESFIPEVRKQLGEMNCESEVFLERKIVAVNIPKEIEYKPIRDYLNKGEQNGLWTYEESCLSHSYE